MGLLLCYRKKKNANITTLRHTFITINTLFSKYRSQLSSFFRRTDIFIDLPSFQLPLQADTCAFCFFLFYCFWFFFSFSLFCCFLCNFLFYLKVYFYLFFIPSMMLLFLSARHLFLFVVVVVLVIAIVLWLPFVLLLFVSPQTGKYSVAIATRPTCLKHHWIEHTTFGHQ